VFDDVLLVQPVGIDREGAASALWAQLDAVVLGEAPDRLPAHADIFRDLLQGEPVLLVELDQLVST
jgi:hypothetical protein